MKESPQVPLAPDTVHVWQAALLLPETVLDEFRLCLSDDEKSRANRLIRPMLGREYVAVHGILRLLLGRYLAVDPSEIRLDAGLQGKPRLDMPGQGMDLRFNLSHSGGLALFAVALGREVGVDVECLGGTSDLNRLAERYFAPAERAALRAVSAEEKAAALFRCWTRKEAYLKARGDGLTVSLDKFSVPMSPAASCARLGQPVHEGEPDRWVLYHLEPGAGYIGALAVEGHVARVVCKAWDYPG